jgi:hypothetical protein
MDHEKSDFKGIRHPKVDRIVDKKNSLILRNFLVLTSVNLDATSVKIVCLNRL